jgi:hypothetical protein
VTGFADVGVNVSVPSTQNEPLPLEPGAVHEAEQLPWIVTAPPPRVYKIEQLAETVPVAPGGVITAVPLQLPPTDPWPVARSSPAGRLEPPAKLQFTFTNTMFVPLTVIVPVTGPPNVTDCGCGNGVRPGLMLPVPVTVSVPATVVAAWVDGTSMVIIAVRGRATATMRLSRRILPPLRFRVPTGDDGYDDAPKMCSKD